MLVATDWLELLCRQSNIRSRGMTQFEQKVSLAHNRRAAHSVAFMLHVWYAIAFWLDSHLGDLPFFYFFKNVELALGFSVSVTDNVSVRVTV